MNSRSLALCLGTLVVLTAAADDTSNEEKEAVSALIRIHKENRALFPDEALLPIAMAYAVTKDYDGAEPLYQRFVAAMPDVARGHRGLGNLYEFKGNLEKALEEFQKGWALGDIVSLLGVAGAHLQMKRPADVGDLAPAMLRHKFENIDLVTLLVAYAIEESDREVFLETVSDVSDAEILKYDGVTKVVLAGLDKFGDAKRAATLRAKMKAGMPRAGNRTAFRITHLVEDPGARKPFLKVYEKSPQIFLDESLVVIGYSYMYEKQWAKAEVVWRKYLDYKPDSGRAHGHLGFVMTNTRGWLQAIEVLKKGWQLGDFESLRLLAFGYFKLGENEKAGELIPALVERSPSKSEIIVLLVGYTVRVRPDDSSLFTKTIEEMTDEDILRLGNNRESVLKGMEKFGIQERAAVIRKKIKESEKQGLKTD